MSYVVKKLLKLSKLNYLVCRIISADAIFIYVNVIFSCSLFHKGLPKGLALHI